MYHDQNIYEIWNIYNYNIIRNHLWLYTVHMEDQKLKFASHDKLETHMEVYNFNLILY